jgi:hypothetical protein
LALKRLAKLTTPLRGGSGSGLKLIIVSRVTITDAEKRTVVRIVTSNADGEFSAPLLQAGIYDITVEAPNFKKRVERGVKLDLSQRRSVDLALEIGAVSEVVMVEASPIAIETSTPTASTLINGVQIRELSLNNRNGRY